MFWEAGGTPAAETTSQGTALFSDTSVTQNHGHISHIVSKFAIL